MNTQDFERIKNEVAQRKGYRNWDGVLASVMNGYITSIEMDAFANEAAMQFAKECQPKWVSVDERLPENRTYVLGHYYNGYDIFEFKHGCFFIGYNKNEDVTHWQPLPPAPVKTDSQCSTRQ